MSKKVQFEHQKYKDIYAKSPICNFSDSISESPFVMSLYAWGIEKEIISSQDTDTTLFSLEVHKKKARDYEVQFDWYQRNEHGFI